jgi:hypothetical protein
VRIGDLDLVLHLAAEREQLRLKIEDSKLAVVLDCEWQDSSIVELVRPVILCELQARKASVERRLAQLGVEVT